MGLSRLFVPIMALHIGLLGMSLFNCVMIFKSERLFVSFPEGSSIGRAAAFAPARFMSRTPSNVFQVSKAANQVVGSKISKLEKDPGVVKGTKLRILRYPNPLVSSE